MQLPWMPVMPHPGFPPVMTMLPPGPPPGLPPGAPTVTAAVASLTESNNHERKDNEVPATAPVTTCEASTATGERASSTRCLPSESTNTQPNDQGNDSGVPLGQEGTPVDL